MNNDDVYQILMETTRSIRIESAQKERSAMFAELQMLIGRKRAEGATEEYIDGIKAALDEIIKEGRAR